MAVLNQAYYEALYRLRVDDQASAGLQAATAAIEKRNAAIAAGDVVETQAANSGARILRSFDDRGKALATLTTLERKLAEAQAAASADAATGGAKQDNFARAIANISVKADEARAKLQALDAASQGNATAINAAGSAADTASARLQKMADEADRATKFLNTFDGANSASLPSGVYEHATSAISAYGTEVDRLRSKYDPLYAAEKRHKDELAEIEALTKVRAISDQAAATALGQSADTYTKATKGLNDTKEASNGAAYAARNMGIQFVQGISGIATGMPVMQTFIQQGHQVVDTALASGQGVKSMGDAFKGMIAGIGGLPTLIGVGVVGALGALVLAGNNALGRLAELRTALRGSQEDYAGLAKTVEDTARRVAASSELSTSAATKAATVLASSKYFAGTSSDLERLTRDAADLGAVLGGDATAGAQKLSAGLTDTYKTAQDLASGPNGLRTLDSGTLHLIDTLQTAGDRSGAFAVLLKAVESAAKGAAADVSPLASAWNELANAFSSSTTKGQSFSAWLANGVADIIRTTAQEINAIKDAIKGLDDFLTSMQNKARSFVGASPMRTGEQGGQAQLTASPSKEAFVSNWLDAAKSAGQQLGISPNVILGHWAVETNYGKSLYDNNPGNIQAGSNYLGATTVRGDTHADGSAYQTQFRAYNSQEDFVKDFVALLNNPRYAAARNTNDDPLAYGGGLRRGGYMEDAAAPGKIAAAANNLSGITGGVSEGMINNAKALNDEYGKLAEGTRALEAIKLDARLADIDKQMQGVDTSTAEGAQKYAVLKQRQEEVNAAIYKNVDAQTEAQRAAESSLRANAGETAGLQGLNAELEKARQLALTTGSPFGSAQEQQATINYLAQQSQAFDKLTYSMGEAQNNSAQMAQAYDKGNQAALVASASQRALTEAMKLFPNSAEEQGAAVRTLTQTYLEMDRAAGEAAVAQQNLGSRDNLAYIEAETASVGMNEGARQKLLATMKAEQEMHRKFGDILPQEAQDYIALAGATVQAQANLQQMQSSFTDLQNIGVNAFNQVGDAIVEALVNGNNKAIDFGNIFKGIIASIIKQLAELAIINPIINTVFGTNRSTLGAAMDAFGSGGNGIGTAVVGAGATYLRNSGSSPYGAAGGTGAMLNTPAINGTAAGRLPEGTEIVSQAGNQSMGQAVYGLGSLAYNSTGASAETAVANVTGYFGNATGATDLALNAAGEGVYGVATAGQVGMASFGEAAGVGAESLGVISSGVSAIGSALPYIGTAIGVATDLAKGDYRGASLIAAGAAIGTFIPGLGTALGAAIGGVIGALLPNHPLNPYQTTGVNVENGRLVQGESSSQLEDASGAINSVQDYARQVNDYLAQVHLVIANPNGRIGGVGDNVTGFEQVKNVSDLFQTLSFRPDDSFDKDSNYYKALKSSLDQTKFMTPEELQSELVNIAKFSQGLDTFGLKLATTGQHLTDIKIDSILDPGKNDFRTALAHDLPGQTFKDSDALFAEIEKVNQFVNGTIPSLLNPVLDTTSDLQKQIQAMVKTYAEAIDQAQKYGLATDDLTVAQGKAVALLQVSALRDLAASNVGIAKRGAAARGEDTSQYDVQAFDLQAEAQREALKQQYINIYGSLIPDAKEYGAAAEVLDKTLAAERLKIINGSNGSILASDQNLAAQRARLVQQERAAYDANFSVLDKFNSIRARASAAAGDQKSADLYNFDDAAMKEQMDYARQLVDYYGDAFYQSSDYNNRMLELTRVQEAERLEIIKKYGAAGVDATGAALEAAKEKVGTLLGSLKDYASSLQVGSDSPLSAMSQYNLAKSQFQAVQGAAAAGDFASASKLQSYSQSFLTASRAVNGSGAGYAGDFQSVLTALQGVADANTDTLTNSAMVAATQTQTAQLSTKFDELKAELVALRREYQQQARAA